MLSLLPTAPVPADHSLLIIILFFFFLIFIKYIFYVVTGVLINPNKTVQMCFKIPTSERFHIGAKTK
jgi:hypothetical protein